METFLVDTSPCFLPLFYTNHHGAHDPRNPRVGWIPSSLLIIRSCKEAYAELIDDSLASQRSSAPKLLTQRCDRGVRGWRVRVLWVGVCGGEPQPIVEPRPFLFWVTEASWIKWAAVSGKRAKPACNRKSYDDYREPLQACDGKWTHLPIELTNTPPPKCRHSNRASP